MSNAILYYVHDPMCSWCWGFHPTWTEVQRRLPQDIEVRYVVGGLAPDSDQPMPEHMKQEKQDIWRKIRDMLGTPFNFDYWTRCTPRWSTYPACRAVLAAERQDRGRDMIFALQRAYYLRAINPSDTSTHLQLADELGLDVRQFEQDIGSDETETALQAQIQLGRRLGAQGFPSLILETNGKTRYFQHDYLDAGATLKAIAELR